MGINWDSITSFQRYEKLDDLAELQNIGDSVIVTFADDGGLVTADKIKRSLEEKGKTNVKPADSYIFVVDYKGALYELWVKTTNYSAMNQIKEIRTKNSSNLKGVKVKITRQAKEDVKKSSFDFKIA